METTREELEFRHLREFTEIRARQKAELVAWDTVHGLSSAPDQQTVQFRAESFLRVYLADGGRSFREIVGAGAKVGLRLEPLRKAKALLGIESYKVHWHWYWRFRVAVQNHTDLG